MYILALAAVKKHRVNLRIGSQMVVVTKGKGGGNIPRVLFISKMHIPERNIQDIGNNVRGMHAFFLCRIHQIFFPFPIFYGRILRGGNHAMLSIDV